MGGSNSTPEMAGTGFWYLFARSIIGDLLPAIPVCTNISHPNEMGFAFKNMFEVPADPLFEKYLSVNSSQHLEYHYSSVRDSLNPVQLAGFDQSLRDTIGGNGTVVYGGVGVMALALAMLFDVLAAQMKGQKPLAGPIQQIFHGEGEALSKMRITVSDCLDRLPRGASDKEKMLLEMERCGKHVEDTLSNYTVHVLDQAQTTGHYVNATERNNVLNAYLFYAHLIMNQRLITASNEIDELDIIEEKMLRLLYIFAPNVTYAVQNWEQQNMKSLCKPIMVMLYINHGLTYPSNDTTLPNITINEYQSSGMWSVMNYLSNSTKYENFVVLN